jgi:hypothetical protein
MMAWRAGAFLIWLAAAAWSAPQAAGPDSLFGTVSLRKTGEQGRLINLSATQDQYDRRIVQWTTRSKVRDMKNDEVEEIIWPLPRGYDPRRDLYRPHEYPKHRWAMVVDLRRCIQEQGCTDCIQACHKTHNVPDFGNPKDEVNEAFSHLKIGEMVGFRAEEPKRE